MTAATPTRTPSTFYLGEAPKTNWLQQQAYLGSLYIYPDANNAPEVGLGSGSSPFCYNNLDSYAFPPSRQDTWTNNTCFVMTPAGQESQSSCDPLNPLKMLPFMADNRFFFDSGNYTLHCGPNVSWTWAQAQAVGVDVGSTSAASPSVASILATAEAFVQDNLMVGSYSRERE